IIGVPYADWPEIVQPDVSFEKIVAGAVAFMTERAPPLVIAGQSYGGHVAYAAALALSAAGRSVGFLGILDTAEVIRTPPLTLSTRLVDRARWGRVLQDLRRATFARCCVAFCMRAFSNGPTPSGSWATSHHSADSVCDLLH